MGEYGPTLGYVYHKLASFDIPTRDNIHRYQYINPPLLLDTIDKLIESCLKKSPRIFIQCYYYSNPQGLFVITFQYIVNCCQFIY